MKEALVSYGGQQTGDAPYTGRTRKPARSRGASSSDVPRKQQRSGEEKAADADVTDMIAQEHLKLSTQLEARVRDLESATHCILFLPTESDTVKEMQKRRQVLQRHGGKPTKRGQRRSTHLALQRDAKSHRKGSQRSRSGNGTLQTRERQRR